MLAHRYALPALSGVLLALVFFPFYLWPLAFIALAPLFYFSTQEHRTVKEVFFGGCIVGIVGIGPLIYLSLAQISLFPDAQAFTFLIRASSIPTVLFVGALFGSVALSFRFLHSRLLLLSPLAGASLYLLLVETPLFWVFDGYYYGAFSHAVVSFPPALSAASFGGAALVSFLVALTNGALAEAYAAPKRNGAWASAVLVLAGWGGLFLLSERLVSASGEATVTVIQGEFEKYIEEASSADLVVFPSARSEGIVSASEDAAEGRRLAQAVPSETTVLLWQTVSEGDALYDEYALWRGGEKSNYRKRELYALSDDYTPAWLRAFGIEKSPYGITPGLPENFATLNSVRIGALICSELHQTELARTTAAEAPFIIAAGSDAMFPGPLSGDFSLAAARLRAAENARPVIRGNLEGPSALINADGSVQIELVYGQEGVLRGVVSLVSSGATPYAKTGSTPVFALALLFVGAAAAARRYWRYDLAK